jgi:hypothetical protein
VVNKLAVAADKLVPRSVLFCEFLVQLLHKQRQVLIWLFFYFFIVGKVWVFLDAEQKGIVH